MIAASQQRATPLLHIIFSLRLIAALRNDKNEIFRAASAASAAADYVLGRDRNRTIEAVALEETPTLAVGEEGPKRRSPRR
jgi:antirestriction protein ArdC